MRGRGTTEEVERTKKFTALEDIRKIRMLKDQGHTPTSPLLPLENVFITIGCKTVERHMAIYWYLLGIGNSQIGIIFVLKRIMIKRKIARVMTVIFLKCFQNILLRIFVF